MRKWGLLVVLLLGCGKDGATVEAAPRIDLICHPCTGTGTDVALNTSLPVPIADIVNHDLCFAPDNSNRCWYGCPGSVEDSVFKGDQVCGAGQ
jgi:hypothetical protein